MTRFRSRLARARRGGDTGFALVTSILLIMVVGALSVAVAGVVLNQTQPTKATRKQVGAINAAQSGFEVALHQMRFATDVNGNGIPTQLPCSMTDRNVGTVLKGAVGKDATGYGYQVAVRYYYIDPTNQDLTWLRNNVITCTAGKPSGVPQYAYLEAVGLGGGASSVGNRDLHTTYQFRTTNLNVAGGRLGENTTSLCMDAGTNPQVGSNVTVTACQPRANNSQSWAYRKDLTIYVAGSGLPGLCLSGGTSAVNTLLTLQTCITTSANYPYSPASAQTQKWSFDDNGKFEGAGSTGNLNGNCIAPNTSSPISGAKLYLVTCSSGGFDYMTWNPDKQAGAGFAGEDTSQLVNYEEFGRCLDVTDQNVSRTWLITYPCKQAPQSSLITWNQKWTYKKDSNGYYTLVTYNGGSTSSPYCLQGPTTGSGYVTVATCNNSTRQRWTKVGEVPGNYATSYQITNSAGLCLSLAAGQGDAYHQLFSSIYVEACDGSLKQKWNAPADFVDSRLKNTVEDQGGA